MSGRCLNDEEIISATWEIDSDFEVSENDSDNNCEAAEVHETQDSKHEFNTDEEEVIENLWTAGSFVSIICEFDDFASGIKPDTRLTENST